MLRVASLAGALAGTFGWTVVLASPAVAQEHVTVQSELLFYGDNTEFRNPFREGETIFGTAVRAATLLDVNDRVQLALGGYGNLRFGGEDAFEQVRPVVSLTLRGRRSAFVFGTLSAPRAGTPPGPDRAGPHGLLPPLQRDTLAFERPYEAGLAWTFAGSRLHHDLWLNWQRLNTSDHRERFDAGASGELQPFRAVAFPFQLHVVHEGGQQFARGPVADSAAFATGVHVRGPLGRLDRAGLELFGLVSRFIPDRGAPGRSTDGAAFFARASAERSGWRGYLIVWRGKAFIKDEGDPNYLSQRRDGSRHRGIRDYAETGLSRTFRPAPDVLLEASGRFHRVEKHYEYSFRILANISLAIRLR